MTGSTPSPPALPAPLPPGDYVRSQSELTVRVELTFPISSAPPRPHPRPSQPTTSAKTKMSPSRAGSRAHHGHPDRLAAPKSSPSRVLTHHEQPKSTPACPFGRLVYIVSSEGASLVQKVISLVNETNTTALGLQDLSKEVLPAALSTYKLTK